MNHSSNGPRRIVRVTGKRYRSPGSRTSFQNTGRGGARSGEGRPGRDRARSGSFSRTSPRKHVVNGIDISRLTQKAVITEQAEQYVPEHRFADFPVNELLQRNIHAKGYVTPTPIQDKTILHVLHGQDVVGIANTGTGKTAAFLIPLLEKVMKDKNGKVLIVVPTRELALQIHDEFKGFSPRTGLLAVTVIGGAPLGLQVRDLRHWHHFVIGTPGRIRDMIERKALDLSKFRTVVLDEADRMLDMGFIGEMRYLMGLMPKPRQTLFFSATISREIEGLIGEFLVNPVRISVKTQETSKNVDQGIIRTSGKDKIEVLAELLRSEGVDKALVFGRTKHGVEKLARVLQKHGFLAESIHGDKTLGQRKRALEAFKKHEAKILVATDVAARGLDIPNVTHVINYDMPATYEDYVHRIGRTGRAGKAGKAITFVE